MKIKKNGKVITLSESDLKKIVKRTLLKENNEDSFCNELIELCEKYGMSCDCDEVIKVLGDHDIEDNPWGI